MAAAEGRAHRQREFFRKARDAIAGLLRPAAAAKEHDRLLAAASISANFAISAGPGAVSTSSKGGASATATRSISMSSGMATTTGPGRPLAAV